VTRARCFLAALAVLLLVAACAQAPLKPPAGPVDFDLGGRIAARYGAEAFTGNLNWRHAATGDDLIISTPFGQGVARIVREGDAVQLTTSDNKSYRAPDAESLTERTLGFRLPLEGLADWVQGRPSPDTPAKVQKGADGRVSLIEQRGWKIEYQEYDGERPYRMRLTYPDVELRLAIAQWR
jgi:outer membrane lipoprotein LolB